MSLSVAILTYMLFLQPPLFLNIRYFCFSFSAAWLLISFQVNIIIDIVHSTTVEIFYIFKYKLEAERFDSTTVEISISFQVGRPRDGIRLYHSRDFYIFLRFRDRPY